MSSVHRIHYLLVSIILFCCAPISVLGETTDDLILKLRSLRNTDSGLEKVEKWSALKKSFDEASKTSSDPKLLFYRAMLYQELGVRKKSKRFLEGSALLYRKTSELYPEDDYADDALYRAYKIYTVQLNDLSQGEEVLSILKRDYPESRYLYLVTSKRSLIPPEVFSVKRVGSASAKGERITVVLDPGHGGEDKGAVGVAGLREKDLALSLSLEIKRALVESGCCNVLMTRTYDIFVPLFERAQFANEKKGDLFVSVHLNADGVAPKRTSGFEVYYVSEKANSDALSLISRENSSGGVDDGALQGFLVDLYKRGNESASKPFAEAIYKDLKSTLAKHGSDLVPRGVKKGPFYVLMGLEMPAVLLELLFMTHPGDVLYLSDPKFRRLLGESIALSIADYSERIRP